MWHLYFFHTLFAPTSSTRALQFQDRAALCTGSGPEGKGKNCFLPTAQISGEQLLRTGRPTRPLLSRLPSRLLMRTWHLVRNRWKKRLKNEGLPCLFLVSVFRFIVGAALSFTNMAGRCSQTCIHWYF